MMELREAIEVRTEGWRERLALGGWCGLVAAVGWVRVVIRMSRMVRLTRLVLLRRGRCAMVLHPSAVRAARQLFFASHVPPVHHR